MLTLIYLKVWEQTEQVYSGYKQSTHFKETHFKKTFLLFSFVKLKQLSAPRPTPVAAVVDVVANAEKPPTTREKPRTLIEDNLTPNVFWDCVSHTKTLHRRIII
jgi:hypothetical protein